MTSNHHAPYDLGHTRTTMAVNKVSRHREIEESTKSSLSSDCRLQPACMKPELLVIADQHAASVFYCCSVKAVDGSLVSDTVYSDMVEVNYIKKATEAPGIAVTPGTDIGNGTAVNGTTGNGTDILTPPEPALKSHNTAVIIIGIGLILLAIALAIIAAVLISRRRKEGRHGR